MAKRTFRIECLLLLSWLVGSTACAQLNLANDAFKTAASHYKLERWGFAAIEFAEFVANHPNHTKTADARYYLGESLIQQQEFAQAAMAFEQFICEHPSDPRLARATFRVGEAQMLAGNDKIAEPLLQQFAERYPQHELNECALYYLGDLATKHAPNANTAIAYYEQLIDAFPDGRTTPNARLAVAVEHYRVGRVDTALTMLRELDSQYADEPNQTTADLAARTRYWLGVAQLANQNFLGAAKSLLTVPEVTADQRLAAASTFFAAEAYRADGQLKEADRLYRTTSEEYTNSEWDDDAACGRIRVAAALNQYDLLERLAKSFIDKHPDSKLLHSVVKYHARSLMAQKRFAAAEQRLISAQEATAITTPAGDSSSFQFMVAICQLGQAHWQSALETLEAITPHPNSNQSARISMARGSALFELGDYEAAATELAMALNGLTESSAQERCLTTLVQTRLAQVKLLAIESRWQDALHILEELELQHCNSATASALSYWLAEAQFRVMNYEAAHHLFAKLASTPASQKSPEWRAVVPLRLAQLHAAKSNWKEALKLATQVRDKFPSFNQRFEADYLIGRCMSKKARFSEARDAYREVVNSTSANQTETAAMAQWMIGETYFHQRDYANAIQAYTQVDTLNAAHRWKAAAMLQTAKCFELTGEVQQANKFYHQVMTEYPNTSFATDAKSLHVTAKRIPADRTVPQTR